MTFVDASPWEAARSAASELTGVPQAELMLTPNSTFGIQLVMQSLLLKEGDEFVTDHLQLIRSVTLHVVVQVIGKT